nr:MAG TPA: hypothetical protein [Bacteriophage sp.]
MIDLTVTKDFIYDLKDDFTMNDKKDLYQFIDGDLVKAFYLGINIEDWFQDLPNEKKYLYSKQIRHNKDNLEKYQKQLKFWTSKFPSKTDEIDLVDLSEYILNNMIYEDNSDEINLAFSLGKLVNNESGKSS